MFKECTECSFSNPALMAYELFSLLSQFLLEFLFTSWLNRVKLVLVSCKISLVLCDPATDFMLVGPESNESVSSLALVCFQKILCGFKKALQLVQTQIWIFNCS